MNVDQQQQDGAGLQQQQKPGKVQLSEFWPQVPNAWFAAAELKFEVAHSNSVRERFVHAVRAMGFNVLRALLDPVENPPPVDPYTTLKGCLVLADQLTPVQKATRCLQVVAGTNQRPSEVLASLLEFCPAGEECTAFFRAALTMRLLVTIQAHLTGTELTNIKELAQLADRLWQCHRPQAVAAVPVDEGQAEEDTSDVFAAVSAKRRPQYKQGSQQGHPMGQQDQQVAGGKSGRGKGGKFLCAKHARYGEDAFFL